MFVDSVSYTENLAAGTSLDIRGGIQLWADEVADYNPSNPRYSHFTQVVWKGTTGVGCASTQCNGMLGSGAGDILRVQILSAWQRDRAIRSERPSLSSYQCAECVEGCWKERRSLTLARNEWEPGSRVTNEALLLYQV
ncbi:hypothetical protein FA13DRAFT_455092 [Coprinellus micaceus]|uniref:SCP domain-containing protein n=1 Tax=Coprinellus micaceus TaxID=71717 RepID=A0A4Y7TYE5_COPMI|nr:hypothetical protein FA13DRAFT_455092 [Coprinellus micaceus]